MEFTEIPVKYRQDIETATALLKNEGCKSIVYLILLKLTR
jgi:hypothetical protein